MGEELRATIAHLVDLDDAAWEAFQQMLKPKELARHEHFLV